VYEEAIIILSYKKFQIVIAGLDNVEARIWLNETLCDLVEYGTDGEIKVDSIIPLIDGGTEGFNGQARLFLPRMTSCYECSLASMPEEKGHFHLCTLADVPRIPEHCIQWALITQWPLLESFTSVTEYKMGERKDEKDEKKMDTGGVQLDKDNVNHMTWIFNRDEERAKKFGIGGVTYHLTQQVVKHIIPAIASTNALISAACVNEALKFLTHASYNLNNYLMYTGQQQTGTHSETFKYKRNPHCRACKPPVVIKMDQKSTLQEFVNILQTDHGLEEPTFSSEKKVLYERIMASSYTDKKLNQPMSELVKSGDLIKATDKNKTHKKVIITFEN